MNRRLQWACLVWSLMLSCGASLPTMAKKNAALPDGKKLFQQNCASCHQAGDNNVNATKPVAGSNELTTLASFKNYLKAPPGHMPYYEHVVKNDAVLKALYKYCKQLKKVPLKQACL